MKQRKNIKTMFGWTSVGLACMSILGGALPSVANAEAEVNGTAYGATSSTASVNVAVSCSMTSTVDAAHTATLANGIYSGAAGYYPNGIGQTTIKSFCNDPEGYAIYAVGYTGDSATGNNTVLHSASLGNTYDIATGTATSGDTSNWAMKVSPVAGVYAPSILSDDDGSYASFHKVPANYTKVAKFTSGTDSGPTATVGSSVTTTYAAYINSTQPAGTYTGKVKYTLMHPSGSAAPDADTMQNVASWGSSLLVGEEAQVVDERDNKAYTVARLCTNYNGDDCTESQIWMTQNLDLEIGSTTLDSINTNIKTDLGSAAGYSTDTSGKITWTPGSTVTTPATNTQWNAGNNATVSGWTNTTTAPYYMEGGDHYVYNGTIYNSLSACEAASHTEAQCKHYHVGNYYNWSAAVASNNTGSITAQYTTADNSICPKGWRLPKGLTNPDGTVTQSEFNKLLSAQGVANGTDLAGSTNVGYTSAGWGRINTTGVNGDPLYFVRSGLVDDTTLYHFSWNGYYWSSTAQSGSYAYSLYFYSGGLYPALVGYRGGGWSVRCVAE